MTFNIRYDSPTDGVDSWDNRKKEVCHLIDLYHPDFVGIQESMPNQVQYINKQLKDYTFVGFGRDGENTNSESVPIFYNSKKYQLLNSKVFWLSPTPNEITKGWDAALNRITTYGTFINKKTKDTISVFNTHFDHIGKIARTNSAKIILEKIIEYKLLKRQVIVMGDLNSLPEDEAMVILKNKLKDAYEVSKKKPTGPEGTFNGFDYNMIPENRIDYIFTQNLKVLTYKVLNDKRNNQRCISDHLPVLVEVSENIMMD
jgi:endonuclease/exonuclease/phosphatase family metal-dependent hydrolase